MDYSDCLLDLPDHQELVFNFDESEINHPDIDDAEDEPDVGGKL